MLAQSPGLHLAPSRTHGKAQALPWMAFPCHPLPGADTAAATEFVGVRLSFSVPIELAGALWVIFVLLLTSSV